MSAVIQNSIRAGETTTRTAERFLHVSQPTVELPRYVQELSKAARFPRGPGDPNLYEDAVKKWQRQIDRLGQGANKTHGEFTIKSATQQLVKDLRKAKPAQVDKIVDRWILERARYQARTVARNEGIEAARDVQLKGYAEQPWVVGVRWTLSSAHPKQDICDVLAEQNLYDLGPGCYPIDKVPARHVSDLCVVSSVVDSDYLKREANKLRNEPEPPKPWQGAPKLSSQEWLLKQPLAVQHRVAGPTRAELARQGVNVFTRDGSALKPVYQLLEKPKPKINYGPKVDASKVVEKDRQSMVMPFPALEQKKTAG